MEDNHLSEKIVEMLAKGQISLSNCQVNLDGQNTMNCGVAEKNSSLSETADMSNGIVLPEALNRAECLAALQKLVDHHLMDADYQPIGMTWSERGILVEELSSRFALEDKWKFFGTLWHVKP